MHMVSTTIFNNKNISKYIVNARIFTSLGGCIFAEAWVLNARAVVIGVCMCDNHFFPINGNCVMIEIFHSFNWTSSV